MESEGSEGCETEDGFEICWLALRLHWACGSGKHEKCGTLDPRILFLWVLSKKLTSLVYKCAKQGVFFFSSFLLIGIGIVSFRNQNIPDRVFCYCILQLGVGIREM